MVKIAIMGYGVVGSGVGEVLRVHVDSIAKRAKEEGKQRTILFNLSGHGLVDLYAYEQYFAGKLPS